MSAELRHTSFFSARTYLTNVLDKYKSAVENILQPTTEQRQDRVTPENPQGNVTTGLNPATARQHLREFFERIGYQPRPGEAGTIKDLSSDGRIDLVVDTAVPPRATGTFIQGNANQDVVDMFPAWELVRFEARRIPRGEAMEHGELVPDPENSWEARFKAAAQASGDDDALRVLNETGRMLARKDSPLWDSLGDGAGGHDDTLGNPFPPSRFAPA